MEQIIRSILINYFLKIQIAIGKRQEHVVTENLEQGQWVYIHF